MTENRSIKKVGGQSLFRSLKHFCRSIWQVIFIDAKSRYEATEYIVKETGSKKGAEHGI